MVLQTKTFFWLHHKPFQCSRLNLLVIALKWVVNHKKRAQSRSLEFPSRPFDPMECPYQLVIAHAVQQLAILMERSSPVSLVADAVSRTTPSQIQTVERAAEVAQKYNGMDRKYCFAYDIVGTPMMIGIVPGIRPAQMNYCIEYDWPMFRRQLLHPDAHSYSVEN